MSKLKTWAFVLILPLLVLAGLSCGQYDYSSPLPGIIEVRLSSHNTRENLIPYGGVNRYQVTLQDLEAQLPGDIKLPIYATLNALRRNRDLDIYNTLSEQARDSAIVMGAAYAPPGTYTGLLMVIEPGTFVLKDFGTHTSFIPVQPLSGFPTTRRFTDLSIPVEEGRVTVVTVTFDMDEALIQRYQRFEYKPVYRVTSVVKK